MKFDEARSECFQGARIRHSGMQPASYIDYQFNGLRINFAGGSSSGWRPLDIDREADWEVDTMEPPPKPIAPAEGGWVAPGLWAKRETIDLPGVVSFEQAQRIGKAQQERNFAPKWGTPRPSVDKWGQSAQSPAPKRDKWGRVIE